MNEHIVIFGVEGRPVGSIEGDDIFDAQGNHIACLEDDFLFDTTTGKCHGSLVNGVVYNVHGHAEGFTVNAKPGVALLGPTLSALPPKVKSFGQSVEGVPRRTPPAFFIQMQERRKMASSK